LTIDRIVLAGRTRAHTLFGVIFVCQVATFAGVGVSAALKGDATHWLTDLEYAALRHRLEAAHEAAEAALVEARRRVRIDEGR
jgi:hypothetical protein